MTDKNRRDLADARLDAVATDLRNRRAAGLHIGPGEMDDAIDLMEEIAPTQGQALRLALSDLRANRRINPSAIARRLGRSRRTVRDALKAGAATFGIVLTMHDRQA